MREIHTPRRYALLKRLYWRRMCEPDLEGVWRSKQEALPGTSLPAGFPFAAPLADAGYTTTDDLNGADERELVESGFSPQEAQEILSALAEL